MQTRAAWGPTDAALILTSIVIAASIGCSGDGSQGRATASAGPGKPTVWFTEITADVGLPSPDPWPAAGSLVPVEVVGAGVALLDYDNDEDLDLLQVRVPRPDRPEAPARDRLFRQEADGSFLDVTEESGLRNDGYGQGVAVGDIDNDGDVDLYFANYGSDKLFRNNGDGSFSDVTGESGIRDDLWGSTAAFCDIDRDGDLDLFVVHYLEFPTTQKCYHGGGFEDYCGPAQFKGVPDTLYRNEGNGMFTDVTAAAGLQLPGGGAGAKGLGVICTDLTADGWPDLFVTNDGELNHLWVNRQNATFGDEAIIRGLAVNRFGSPEASMGVTIGDINGDDHLDLFMTHQYRETNTMYTSMSGSTFADRTIESQLGVVDLEFTGFGCGLFDADHDGDLDLAIANGRVHRGEVLPGAELSDFWNLYAEPNLLFANDGNGIFTEIGELAGSFGSTVEISRGLAFGDVDRDGDLDMALSSGANSIRLYRNDAPDPVHHWVIFRALSGKRDALGSQITVVTGDRRRTAAMVPHSSYQSSSDPRVHFGLGAVERLDGVEVSWADGQRERFAIHEVDRVHTLRQGSGESL